MMQGSLQPAAWARENFGTAKLGHKRRTKRLVESAKRAAEMPGGSLPHMMRDPAALDGFYRLVDQSKVTHASVLEPHVQRTRQRMREQDGTVLILKDSTELDFTTHKTLTKIGQIGNGSRRGYLCHNSLAVDAKTNEVLGLADQRLLIRPQVPEDETRAACRARENRQSRLWVNSSDAVGAAPPGKRWIEVCDREADTFEYHGTLLASGRHFVVRSKSNRNCVYEEKDERRQGKLHDYLRTLPGEIGKQVEVPAKVARAATKKEAAMPAQAARSATIKVSFSKVWLTPPRGQRRGQEELQLWAVRIWEPEPPENVDELEWLLLTSVEVSTAAEALEVGQWYEIRWTIEDFHKGQKTGCKIEEPQFETEERLEPTIAFLSVVAVLLLQMRGLSRSAETKDRPACAYMPPLFVTVLSQWRWPKEAPRQNMTVEEFFYALGRLGGHQNRKSDGPPGWIVLWRGWTQLQSRIDAVRIMQRQSIEET
jgi:Transposase DNA-binding/Transposase DDE domain